MKNQFLPLRFLHLLCWILFCSSPLFTQTFADSNLIIKFYPNTSQASINAIMEDFSATVAQSLPSIEAECWEVPDEVVINGVTLTGVEAMVSYLNSNAIVEYAEPNFFYELDCTPNDPHFFNQWNMHNTGQTGGTPDADIDLPEARCILDESPNVKVAVLDTGIDWRHPDLINNIWQNLGEDADGDGHVLEWNGSQWIFDPGDEDGVDGDNNGYVDDFIGWDFADNDNDPSDFHGHGTHVAGIIGAEGNNGIGVTGVTSKVQLACLKVFSNMKAPADRFILALDYSVSMGIPISNNSWGGAPFSRGLNASIQSALNSNHIFVTAAGNGFNCSELGRNIDVVNHFPASYDHENIISVCYTTSTDNLSSNSNFGQTNVDLAAPGDFIYSTMLNNTYGFGPSCHGGTSFAVPHVTGAIALLLEQGNITTIADIKTQLLMTTDPNPALANKCVSEGRLNVHKLLTQGMNSCIYTDSLALVDFYYATGGGTTWLTCWVLTDPVSTWFGVTLSEDGCSVIELNLSHWSTNYQLTGNLPDLNLPKLEYLNLRNNQLSGPIPNFSYLVSLKEIDLSNNQLSGSIPNFSNLQSLENLVLYSNQLSGSIPNFSNLLNLKRLVLPNNQLSGSIPNFSNLQSLEDLILGNNQLSGAIPDFDSLSTLTGFWVGDNQLSDTIPNFSNLPNLRGADFYNNQLTGILPEFTNCPDLNYLDVSGNQLSGFIPTYTHLLELKNFFLYNNHYTFAELESTMGQAYNIEDPYCDYEYGYLYAPQAKIPINLVNNTLSVNTGGTTNTYKWFKNGVELVGEVDDFYVAQDVALYYCQITNSLVTNNGVCGQDLVLESEVIYIGNPCLTPEALTLDILELKELYGNLDGENWSANQWNLADPIDTWPGVVLSADGCSVEELHLSNSGLKGILPNLNLPNLKIFDIQGNLDVTGMLPDFSQLPNLECFNASNCGFIGAIPNFNLPNLTHLDLSENNFTGILPDLLNVPSLKIGHFKNNLLEGGVPDFSHLASLEELTLQNNKFTFDGLESNLNHFNNSSIFTTFEYAPQNSVRIFQTMTHLFVLAGGTVADSTFTYEWYKNGNPIDTIIGDNYLTTTGESGLYYCKITNNSITNPDNPTQNLALYSEIGQVINSCLKKDFLELIKFYHATGGENWTIPWDLSKPLEPNSPFWHGVTLTPDGCNVKFIALSSGYVVGNNLVGNLSDLKDLDLPYLTHLTLWNNQLSGIIPDFTNLPSLHTLQLRNNQLSGTVPNFSNLSNLKILDLRSNNLTGIIHDFDALSNLEQLLLAHNKISGTIPDFYNLPNLVILNCWRNRLCGTIPDFSNLAKLREIYLSENHLTGTIPDFSNFPELIRLQLGWNSLTGEIPNFSNLPNLTNLWLRYNQLSGNIPDFDSLQNLEMLILHNNQLEGIIPDFYNLPNLIQLYLNSNQLIGNIPNFTKLQNLVYLFAPRNNLTGNIPNFSSLPSLTALDLSQNQLSDTIPNFDSLLLLENLRLHWNDLTGSIPGFSHLVNLSFLNVSNNNLTDTIPDFSGFIDLTQVIVSNNQLTFEGLELNLNYFNSSSTFTTFSYAPQGTIPIHRTGSAIYVVPGGNLNDNTFTWYEDGNPIDTIEGDNTFTSFTVGKTYHCEVTNDIITDSTPWGRNLVLISEPYTLSNVWPGDVNFDGIVDALDVLTLGIKNGKMGTLRDSTGIMWTPYLSADWRDITPDGIDAKHADCDGNGIVFIENDVSAIAANFGKIHDEGTLLSNTPTNAEVVIRPTEVRREDGKYVITFAIELNNINEQLTDIYGIAFNIEHIGSLSTGTLDSLGGFLGPDAFSFWHYDTITNIFHAALVETDQINVAVPPSSFGLQKLTDFILVEDNIPTGDPTQFILSNIKITDNQGNITCPKAKKTNLFIAEPNNVPQNDSIPDMLAAFTESTDSDCDGGAATVNPFGGTPPYSYLWDNGQATQTVTGLGTGIHQVTVTDNLGVSLVASIDIDGFGLTIINSADFEGGWGGIWNDGGANCRRINNANWASSGTYSIQLRGTGNTSVMTTNSFDFSNFDEVTIDFSYISKGFSNGEDFWFQMSSDGGMTFDTVQAWVAGTHFNNNIRENEQVVLTRPFSSDVQFRFRADASSNSDKVYIDDVVISGCLPHHHLATSIVGQGIITPASGIFAQGSNVVLTATPDAGWQFDSLSGDFISTLLIDTIQMDSAINITAHFSPMPTPQYTLNTSIVGQGSINISPNSSTFDEGTLVTLIATPADSTWQFDSWSGDLSGTADSTTLVVDSDKNVTATFSLIGGGSCIYNTINSADFEGGWGGIWNDGGANCKRINNANWASSGTYSIRLRGNNNSSVMTSSSFDFLNFNEVIVDFSYISQGFSNGEDFWFQISSDGGITFNTIQVWVAGTHFNNNIRESGQVVLTGPFTNDVQFRFRADASSNSDKVYIDDVVISGCTSGGGNPAQYTLTTSTVGQGSISPASGTFDEGTAVALTAIPVSGWQFNGWSGDLSGNTNPDTLLMDFDKNITATFSLIGGGCTYSTIDNEDFEGGWGNWSDGGSDCRRSANDAAFANSGIFCVRLRDDTNTSVMTTSSLDLSSYDEVTIDFSYISVGFALGEDFWLQISSNGAAFNTVEDWVRGTDFENDVRESGQVVLTGPFTSNVQFRFRADASGNSDRVYIDDVVIAGCTTSFAPSGPINAIGKEPIFTAPMEQAKVEKTSTKFQLYPNPATTELTVAYEYLEEVEGILVITDFTGKVVHRMNTMAGQHRLQIDISHLSLGAYFVQLITDKARVTEKFVIVR